MHCMRPGLRSPVFLLALVLSACGGGSDGDDNNDVTAPVLSLPGNLTANATGAPGATVHFTATATDGFDGPRTVTCTPASGTMFALGATTVRCSATDSKGHVADGSFTVTVSDVTRPVLSLPGALSAEATGPSGAEVTWTVSATDNVSGSVPVTCTPGPGLFALGVTTVNCAADDAAGNRREGSFTVTVTDTTAPVLDLPADITVTAAGPSGIPVSWNASASDVVSGAIAVQCSPTSGSLFPVGATTVTCSSTDAAGNQASGTFLVTVDPAPTTVTRISTGALHTCAALSDGTAQCWGSNGNGRLGNGTTNPSLSPSPVLTDPGLLTPLSDVVDISAGNAHSCARIVDGTARCWGQGNFGKLGAGGTTSFSSPTPVLISAGGAALSGVAQISAGRGNHTCALIGGGAVRCWGQNNFGQLGNGTTTGTGTANSFPVAVLTTPGGAELTGATAIAIGTSHSCALMTGGTVRCWGRNSDFGQLGNATNVNSNVPVEVVDPLAGTALTGVVSIAAGANHTCALLLDGTARCWGRNVYGGLGDGTTTHSNVPVAVNGLSGIASIAAGEFNTCVRLDDGTLRCWGRNEMGDLGDGTNVDSLTTPVTVSGISSATLIAVGGGTTLPHRGQACAVLADGTARCWGANDAGQVGDGTDTNRNLPTEVPLP